MFNKLLSNNLILLIILAAIWGSSFFVIKICLSSFTPTSIASLRLIIASLFLIIFYYSYNNHPKLKALQLKKEGFKVSRKLKLNNLLPKIDLQYNFLLFLTYRIVLIVSLQILQY